ncbi:hypothetical protein LTR53_018730, partial [Teratosphaeriaceae sp. CCFEE 6253]
MRRMANGHEKKPLIDVGKANAVRGSHAGLLSPSSGTVHLVPEQAVTEANTPKKIFKTHRKDAFSDAVDPVAVSDRLDGLVVRDVKQFERYV